MATPANVPEENFWDAGVLEDDELAPVVDEEVLGPEVVVDNVVELVWPKSLVNELAEVVGVLAGGLVMATLMTSGSESVAYGPIEL